jgi:phosphohistidine phosphatase
MKVIFVRHATAEPEGPEGDAARRLNETGSAEALATGGALRQMGVQPGRILTSPLPRARETAELIGGYYPDVEIADQPLLAPDADVHQAADAVLTLLDEGIEEVLLVGHGPTIDRLLALVTAGVDDIGTSLSKAGAGCVRVREKKSGLKTELRWLLKRGHLAALHELGKEVRDTEESDSE